VNCKQKPMRWRWFIGERAGLMPRPVAAMAGPQFSRQGAVADIAALDTASLLIQLHFLMRSGGCSIASRRCSCRAFR